MRRFVITLVLSFLCSTTYSTQPFKPAVFANDSYTFIVGFAWPDQNDKVLFIRTTDRTTGFSCDELGVDVLDEWTTAGSQWYQNAIGYVISLRVKGSEAEEQVFYLRHRSGKETIIDIGSNELIEPATILNRTLLDNETVLKASTLLRSEIPEERQTGAIHLGQLRAKEYLDDLTKLLNDNSSYTEYSGDKSREVYFVRDAAETAIQQIENTNTADQ